MIDLIEFVVGQQYENRKGLYEVLEVAGDIMRIRWESGEEVDTTVTMQSHIIQRLQFEVERNSPQKPILPIEESPTPKGWQHRITR